jgi:hypothetical protein
MDLTCAALCDKTQVADLTFIFLKLFSVIRDFVNFAYMLSLCPAPLQMRNTQVGQQIIHEIFDKLIRIMTWTVKSVSTDCITRKAYQL